MDVSSAGLEAALESSGPLSPCGVLVLDWTGLCWNPDLDDLHTGSWPAPWTDARARLGTGTGSQESTWWVQAPQASAGGWPQAFPVWLAKMAGAKSLLLLDRAEPQSRHGSSHSHCWRHLSDVVDLEQQSPLIGLGPSPRGPLFPDRTAALDPALAAEVASVLGSTPAVAASRGPASPGQGPWDLIAPHMAAPLSAAAHVSLPSVALVAEGTPPRLPLPAIMEVLFRTPSFPLDSHPSPPPRTP